MEWFEKLDYYENPFTSEAVDEPFAFDEVLNELYYRVESGSMVFIEGAAGVGKTSVLRSIIRRFRGKKRVIYLDCDAIGRNVDIEKVMHERYGFVGRLFNLTPKNMVLLLDNVTALSKKNAERIKYFFDNNYVKSVVFTGRAYSKSGLPKGIQDRIGSRVVKIKPLTQDESVRLVRERAGNIEFLTDETIKKIYKSSGKNTKRLLDNCSKACSYAVKHDLEMFSDSDLKKALGDNRG